MPLPDNGDVDIPPRAEAALTKKTLVKDWGLKPWELDRLTVGDIQEVMLAEHAESYIEQEQMERQRGRGGSISESEYNVSQSRQNAFQ